MAAVRPAGPDPTMTSWRVSGTSALLGAPGSALGPREGPGRHQNRAEQRVRRPHPAPEGVDVEEPDHRYGGQHAQDEGHDPDDDPEDEAPGHDREGADHAGVDGVDHVLDRVGHPRRPFG